MASGGAFPVLGPVFFYEMVRTGRRTRYFVLRTLYSILLAFLVLNFFSMFATNYGGGVQRGSIRESADIASGYFLTVTWVQFVVLCLVTPAYVAGSISQEKEKKTLEFVLATDLSSREIVLGKLGARLANLVVLMLVGLPIVSMVQFMGGVDPTLVLATTAATMACVASLAALSILNSVFSRRSRDAIAATYLCGVGYLALSGLSWFLLFPPLRPWLESLFPNSRWPENAVYVLNTGNPISMISLLGNQFATGIAMENLVLSYLRDFLLFHGIVFFICCTAAVAWLRAISLKQIQGSTPRTWFRRREARHPAPWQDSLVWKELFVESGLKLNMVGRIVAVLLVAAALLTLWLAWEQSDNNRRFFDAVDVWVRTSGTIGACLRLLAVAGRAATSVSQERDRHTMDAVLTCPVSTDEILFSKWVGAVLSDRRSWVFLSGVYLVGILFGAINWLTLPLVIFAWLVYASVVALIGLFCSVTCKSSLWATVLAYLYTGLAGVGHWLLWSCCLFSGIFHSGYPPPEFLWKFQAGLTPPIALAASFCIPGTGSGLWGSPGPRADASNRAAEWLLFGLIGLACWGVISLLLWRALSNSFGLYCGRADRMAWPRVALPLEGGGTAPARDG